MKKYILVYDASYKTLIGEKPLLIIFDKVDGFIRDYNAARYLALFVSEKYNSIFNKIRYLISVKSSTSYVVTCNYGKTKIDSDDDLFL